MVWAKTGPWKSIIVYMINWYILQIENTPQLAKNTPNCLNCCRLFNYNYLLCDWLRFGQLRPIGNVCCDLLLQSHALPGVLFTIGCRSYVNCMIIYVFMPSVQL